MLEVLYRQTYNRYCSIEHPVAAGSVVAMTGDFTIGLCHGDSSSVFDKAVGIVIDTAEGAVYAHGTGTVINTDIYEPVSYTAGDRLYASRKGLLTNVKGMDNGDNGCSTLIGICLKAPTEEDPHLTIQMRI